MQNENAEEVIVASILEQEIPGTDLALEAVKRTGRPTVLDQLGLTLEQVVECYRNSRSERDAAGKLGFTVRTLRKYLHTANVWPDKTNSAKALGVSFNPSMVYHWIKGQKGVIPRSVAEISRRSGIKQPTIRKFLTRRKHAAENYLATLGSLRDVENAQIVTVKGQKVPTAAIGQALTSVDLYDLSVSINALLRSGINVRCRMSYNEYCRMFGSKDDDLALGSKPTTPSDPRGSTL